MVSMSPTNSDSARAWGGIDREFCSQLQISTVRSERRPARKPCQGIFLDVDISANNDDDKPEVLGGHRKADSCKFACNSAINRPRWLNRTLIQVSTYQRGYGRRHQQVVFFLEKLVPARWLDGKVISSAVDLGFWYLIILPFPAPFLAQPARYWLGPSPLGSWAASPSRTLSEGEVPNRGGVGGRRWHGWGHARTKGIFQSSSTPIAGRVSQDFHRAPSSPRGMISNLRPSAGRSGRVPAWKMGGRGTGAREQSRGVFIHTPSPDSCPAESGNTSCR